jgi:cell wall assembly regulator SMI1
MRDVVERLGKWWRNKRPFALDDLAPGVTDGTLAAYEDELGVTLPDGLRALYRWRNGPLTGLTGRGIIGRYALMSLWQVSANQKAMNDLLGQGATKNGWRKACLPVFSNGTGDFICWDPCGHFGGEKGQMLALSRTDRTMLAPSFDGFLTAYVDSLEAGVWTYDHVHGLDDDGRFASFLSERFPGYPRRAIDIDD